jgi:hypothetical protein
MNTAGGNAKPTSNTRSTPTFATDLFLSDRSAHTKSGMEGTLKNAADPTIRGKMPSYDRSIGRMKNRTALPRKSETTVNDAEINQWPLLI